MNWPAWIAFWISGIDFFFETATRDMGYWIWNFFLICEIFWWILERLCGIFMGRSLFMCF